MKDALDILKRIETVEPPEHLLQAIYARMAPIETEKVPLTWVRGIAAAFALLVAVEGYFLTIQNAPQQDAVVQIVPHSENNLYNE